MKNRSSNYEELLFGQVKSYYKGTETMKNKLGIMDTKELTDVEAAIVVFNLSKLYEQPIDNTFDIKHYLNIHKFLFNKIYSFAGEIRDENIKKSCEPYLNDVMTPFCRPEFVYQNLNDVLIKMKNECLKWSNEDQMVQRLAYYYGEINIIHPFREGNGRTQREFFRQFMTYINKNIGFGEYEIDYSLIKNQPNAMEYLHKGSILNSLKGETADLEKFLKICIKQKEHTVEESKRVL